MASKSLHNLDSPNSSRIPNFFKMSISERISERVVASHVVLCPTGMYSAHSKWIGKELRLAKKLGTPVLAINPWAQERKSSIVLQYAADYVGWRSKPLLESVWRLRREYFGVD